MEAIKFSNKGQNLEVVEIKEHSSIFSSQLGWTHFAGIKRPNGKKVYYANLVIENGKVINSLVVM